MPLADVGAGLTRIGAKRHGVSAPRGELGREPRGERPEILAGERRGAARH